MFRAGTWVHTVRMAGLGCEGDFEALWVGAGAWTLMPGL